MPDDDRRVFDKTNQHMISYGNGKLWGSAGGELEFVSQRIEWRQRPSPRGEQCYAVMVMRFTDHDVQATPHGIPGLIDGHYYELEFPLAMY